MTAEQRELQCNPSHSVDIVADVTQESAGLRLEYSLAAESMDTSSVIALIRERIL